MLTRTIAFLKAHKLIVPIAAAVLIGGGWFGYRRLDAKGAETRYVTEAAGNGTLVTTVSGSGSVSASESIDLKPQASGKLTQLTVVAGQKIAAGTVVARIDASDAYQSYKDAQDGLTTAELSLERLKAPADDFDLLQAERAVKEARTAEADAREGISEGIEDGYNAVVDAYLDLPAVMVTFKDVLYGNTLEPAQSNMDAYADTANRFDAGAYGIRDGVIEAYDEARASYDASYAAYQASSRFDDDAKIEALINDAYGTSKKIAEAAKSATDFIQYYKDQLTDREMKVPAAAASHLTSLSTALGTANAAASSLLGVRNGIAADRKALDAAAWSITQKEQALSDLKEGPDAFDVRAQELSIAQRRNALASAGKKLGDYAVTAPFDGVMASVEAKKGESVSSGTVIGTLITEQKIAEVTLSEIDVARVSVGQKATLAFDAVPDLGISGQVVEVDALGVSSQGVVNYGVKIAFDTQDERIKPGMSVTATIIVEAKPGVLLVPASAVKTEGGASYVEVMPDGATAPERRMVEIGATNDESVEILSGLEESESVVTRTIVPTAAVTPAASPQNTRGFGGGGFGNATFISTGGGAGGAFRR